MTSELGDGRTAWICEACYRSLNGRDAGTLGEDFDRVPLGLVGADTTVTAGLLAVEHLCEDRWVGHRPVIGCGEEIRDHETDACEGCGAVEPGRRQAATFWKLEPRAFG